MWLQFAQQIVAARRATLSRNIHDEGTTMFYNMKGRLTDGRTFSGAASGANPIEAGAAFITANEIDASTVDTIKLTVLTGSTVKLRKAKKKKDEPAPAPVDETAAAEARLVDKGAIAPTRQQAQAQGNRKR